MKVISNSARVLVAAALLLVGVVGFSGSAGAVSTGSVVNNGAGGVTITYSAGQGDTVTILVYSSSSTCATGPSIPPQPLYYMMTNNPQPPILGASPFTLDGTVTVEQSGGPDTTIATGLYQFCLYSESGGSFTLLSSVQTTIGTVTPTTTSSTTSTTSTTAPAADPVAPAFTG